MVTKENYDDDDGNNIEWMHKLMNGSMKKKNGKVEENCKVEKSI